MSELKARKWKGTPRRSQRSHGVLGGTTKHAPFFPSFSSFSILLPDAVRPGGVRTWGGLLCAHTVPSQVSRGGENPNINPGNTVLWPLAARVLYRKKGRVRRAVRSSAMLNWFPQRHTHFFFTLIWTAAEEMHTAGLNPPPPWTELAKERNFQPRQIQLRTERK